MVFPAAVTNLTLLDESECSTELRFSHIVGVLVNAVEIRCVICAFEQFEYTMSGDQGACLHRDIKIVMTHLKTCQLKH
jgi:hypothetical protein